MSARRSTARRRGAMDIRPLEKTRSDESQSESELIVIRGSFEQVTALAEARRGRDARRRLHADSQATAAIAPRSASPASLAAFTDGAARLVGSVSSASWAAHPGLRHRADQQAARHHDQGAHVCRSESSSPSGQIRTQETSAQRRTTRPTGSHQRAAIARRRRARRAGGLEPAQASSAPAEKMQPAEGGGDLRGASDAVGPGRSNDWRQDASRTGSRSVSQPTAPA